MSSEQTVFTLPRDIYTDSAIQKTNDIFRKHCQVGFECRDDFFEVSIRTDAASTAAVVKEYLNFVLHYSAEEVLG